MSYVEVESSLVEKRCDLIISAIHAKRQEYKETYEKLRRERLDREKGVRWWHCVKKWGENPYNEGLSVYEFRLDNETEYEAYWDSSFYKDKELNRANVLKNAIILKSFLGKLFLSVEDSNLLAIKQG